METAQPVLMQGQQQILTAASFQTTPEEMLKLQRINKLGIAEVVLGSLSFICGILLLLFGISLAEGLWCGFIIILAGGFGIAAGKPTATKCITIAHMSFAIIGALFAAVMFSLSVIYTLYIYYLPLNVAFHIILDILAFVSMVLQIVSASYCCCVRGGCCTAQVYQAATASGQMVIVQQQVPATMVQPGVPGMMVYQQQQPLYPNQQQPQMNYNQQPPTVQDEKAGGLPPGANPPAYSYNLSNY